MLKNDTKGTHSIATKIGDPHTPLIQRHLERRGNLEGLFADRIVLIEGNHDESFYRKLCSIFGINFPAKEYGLFIKSCGKDEMRLARKFYAQMGFTDVSLICDLDYLFSNDFGHLLKELDLDETIPSKCRMHINWNDKRDPPIYKVMEGIESNGEPKDFEKILSSLKDKRIFILRHGTPEMYYRSKNGRKDEWENVNSENDLLEVPYLKSLLISVLNNPASKN